MRSKRRLFIITATFIICSRTGTDAVGARTAPTTSAWAAAANLTGPYLDKEGKDLARGGGTLLLGTDGAFIGPGHAGILEDRRRFWFSAHFYDGTERGISKLAIRPLDWGADGWPVLRAITPGSSEGSKPTRSNDIDRLLMELQVRLAPHCLASSADAAEPGKIGGELTISEISERTVAAPTSSSRRTGQHAATESLHSSGTVPRPREIPKSRVGNEKEVRVGQLRVTIRPQPLVIAVRRGNGQLVQELAFEDGTNRAISFRTGGPVLGLGEGAQQFDRRGALYPMEPSWGGWNRAVLGSVVPSPFLVGTEGWALFLPHAGRSTGFARQRSLYPKDKRGPGPLSHRRCEGHPMLSLNISGLLAGP
jgi:hypothetical protein